MTANSTATEPGGSPADRRVKLRKRRAWLAGLLSLLCPGLGQLYNGHAKRAGGFIVLFALWAIAGITPVTSVFAGWLLWGAWIIGIGLAGLIDAYLQARRLGSIVLKRYNHWAAYVGVYVLLAALISTYSELGDHLVNVRLFSTPSASNLPNLHRGDHFAAEGGLFGIFQPRQGEYVVYRHPRNEVDYVKRVVGLPGDRVQMRAGRLYINGVAVSRERLEDFPIPWLGGQSKPIPQYLEMLPNGRAHRILEESDDRGLLDNTPVFEVPAGHYFTLGDNRDNSHDSRGAGHGFVPAETSIANRCSSSGRTTSRASACDWINLNTE